MKMMVLLMAGVFVCCFLVGCQESQDAVESFSMVNGDTYVFRGFSIVLNAITVVPDRVRLEIYDDMGLVADRWLSVGSSQVFDGYRLELVGHSELEVEFSIYKK